MKYIFIQLYLGSRLYVGVILLSCLMAKLSDGKGKFERTVQASLSHHAQKPMGRSKGSMGSTSRVLLQKGSKGSKGSTRLATEQTPEIPSREHSTPTHPATEQKPKIPTTTHDPTPTSPATEQTPETPTGADVTMHVPGNASILRCSDSAVETDTPTERKRPLRHDKDDKEKALSEIHRLLALANETGRVAKAAKAEKDEYESGQQSKRPRKAKNAKAAKAEKDEYESGQQSKRLRKAEKETKRT